MSANFFDHDCGPYCNNNRHSKVIWYAPDHVADPLELLRQLCGHANKIYVTAEAAHEVGPVPVGEFGPWIEGDTGRSGYIQCPADVIPYLLVWEERNAA